MFLSNDQNEKNQVITSSNLLFRTIGRIIIAALVAEISTCKVDKVLAGFWRYGQKSQKAVILKNLVKIEKKCKKSDSLGGIL